MKTLIQGNKYIYAFNSGVSFPYIGNYGNGSGNIRYNSSMSRMEIYDGTSWHGIPDNSLTISMSPDAEEAIEWAQKKMQEEKRIERLIEEHPAVKDAKEKLDILIALHKD